jgi:hypothetical protein
MTKKKTRRRGESYGNVVVDDGVVVVRARLSGGFGLVTQGADGDETNCDTIGNTLNYQHLRGDDLISVQVLQDTLAVTSLDFIASKKKKNHNK